jgi:hypothetical protein
MMPLSPSHFLLPKTIPLPLKKVRSQTYLHEQLKWVYSQGGLYPTEVRINNTFADVQREQLIIEIQTRGFFSLKSKLSSLLGNYSVLVVTTIPIVKTIRKFDSTGSHQLSLRKSPKKACLYEIFNELVHLVPFAKHPRFYLEVLLTAEEEQRRQNEPTSWNRTHQQRIQDRILNGIIHRETFYCSRDYLRLLPADLPETFNTKTLSCCLSVSQDLAQKITYFMRQLCLIEQVGRHKEGIYYQLTGAQ